MLKNNNKNDNILTNLIEDKKSKNINNIIRILIKL